ncbi:hypothetical protein JCM9533A_07860 [Catenuloplanes niger JCM 9533]|uniref:Uncharacterized protein n=1 Tax=Catenuloplanes niger TaxID=587534 RepID=A0AAE3ZJN8_9ACTN|nr:hypothetical protein [Catenuloplanes niger]
MIVEGERWETAEQIGAARRRFEEAIPGYRPPMAHAIMLPGGDFARINVGDGLLPAVILATLLGHRGGDASYPLDAATLDRALALLAPAEACTALRHPNLGVWRWLRGADGLTAVFVASLDESADPAVSALVGRLLAGRVENPDGTTTLWRPVGPAELDLIARSGYAAFPPRLPDQPIFYPVLNEAYAARIAAEWNVEASGAGHVTRFRVATDFARRYPSRQAGGREIAELWIPAEDVPELNAHLVGPIEVVSSSEDRAVSPGPFGEVPESE